MELFRLFGTIALDNAKANQGIDETTDKGEKAQSKLSGAFSKIGSAASVCGKAVAAGMVAASAAIVKIGKDAVASYADYEQLVGGVETLFKDSAGKVQEYAQNAYETAGLSANTYMETVTSFSASLLQSLDGDTAKAAESANLAITDMSDNANKMGTSMELIQNAYQGFAKQNYTMLDNLKLGYGGTKEELERLLSDASKLSGVKYDMSSFDDVVQAIHVVQTEMGITGTTAQEAATTIQGSVSSMKGAWQNLLTGMADENQNLDLLFQQFVDSVVVVGDNLIPRIQTLLPRIVTGISQLASSLSAQLPSIMETVLPSLITGAVNIVASLIQQLPSLAKSIVTSLVSTIQSYWSTIQKSGSDMLQKLLTGIETNLPKLIEEAAEIIASVVKGISNNLPKIIKAAGKIIASLAKGIISALPSLVAKVPTIIASIVKGLLSSIGAIANVGVNIVKGLWQGIGNAKDWIVNKVKGFGSDILNGLERIFRINSPSKATEEDGKNLVLGIGNGITKNSKYAKNIVKKFGEELLSTLEKRLSNYKVYNDMSLQQEADYWDNARKLFKKGTQDRIDADQKYFEAKKNLENQIITDAENNLANEKRIRDVSAAEEASYWASIVAQTAQGSDARIQAEEKYYSALESYQQQYESYVNNIMGQMQLFAEFVQGDSVDGGTLISNLQGQISGMESYYAAMESLNSKIGGTQLMSYLSTLGVDNLSELQAINNMTAEQLQQYVDLYDQKYKMACEKATAALGTVVTTTKDKTKETNSNVKNSMKSMLTTVTKYSADMVSTVKSKFSSIASTIASNMADAVASVRSAVAEMNALLASSSAGGYTTTATHKTTVRKNAVGGILTKPTIFGFTPSTGQWQLGGEAGKEAIAPIDTLQQYVKAAVSEETAEQNSLLARMVELLEALLGKDVSVYLNSKEISKAVNRDLGVIF